MTHQKDLPYNNLLTLPPRCDLEQKEVLKKAISANKALAELRGWSFNQSNPLLLLQSIAFPSNEKTCISHQAATAPSIKLRAQTNNKNRPEHHLRTA